MTRKPLRVTLCPDCGREIGVQPEYNRSIYLRGRSPGWRVSKHGRTRGGQTCTNSGTVVLEAAIYANP